jgi:competence protein ComFC
MCGNPVASWDDGFACRECWEDTKTTNLFFDLAVCRKCGAPLQIKPDRDKPTSDEQFCNLCADLPFEAARSCGAYSGALKASVLSLKTEPHLCPRLREILFRTYLSNRGLIESDLVMAIPLHRLRERERGFNQSSVIVRLIASRFDLAYDDSALLRVAHTDRHRRGMDRFDRAKSVGRAFKVARPGKVMGATVLLIDDLFTTGSTICAAASALLDAGAASVRALTIARAVRSET